ncbi:hypothetical protein CCH79_00017896 [Gambusia affinis]|uniref:Nudix hydrolase domain-containing protein n=1 Tax=Gambusia affinis TaxID=33528 RepID=A0A315VMD4_GAMAF|nr:hypothetical protein CCH79_00017896 [Gambusia affinis]
MLTFVFNMASSAWSERILQLLRRMNNFYSAGIQVKRHTFTSSTRGSSSRSSCLRFEIDGAQVGWIPPHVVSLLTPHTDVFLPPQRDAVSLCPSLDCYEKRSEAVNDVLEALRQESSLTCLRGWRDERETEILRRAADVDGKSSNKYVSADRGIFGVKRYGVHINGYTVNGSGEISMWLARRSATKQTYPGRLDNMAAGGLAADVGIKHTLIKECEEEACIPADIAAKASPVSTVSYTYEDEEGVFPESQFVFDLELPLDFVPRVGDGEVQDFYLLPIEKVKELLASDDFKPNSAMVILDFLIRHSLIEPDTVNYNACGVPLNSGRKIHLKTVAVSDTGDLGSHPKRFLTLGPKSLFWSFEAFQECGKFQYKEPRGLRTVLNHLTAALVAISKTSLTPSFVLAEHSRTAKQGKKKSLQGGKQGITEGHAQVSLKIRASKEAYRKNQVQQNDITDVWSGTKITGFKNKEDRLDGSPDKPNDPT